MEPIARTFALRELLGKGSFGEVYRATMSSAGGLRHDVAVKLLHPDLDPRSQPVERLRDEARVLAALQHPVILQVRDLVVLEGRAALVTEFVPGLDVEALLDSVGPLPTRVALEIVGHVADALDAAFHAVAMDGTPLRLVHRDIKPANLRVTPHGTVKLLDFGIAKAEEPERETSTTSFTLMGSVPYMAPEVLHLDVQDADMPRDVYALGVTLFELLTGEALFGTMNRGEQRAQTARRERCEAWWTRRRAMLEGFGKDVVALIGGMVAYAPADRPTAREVADRAFALAEHGVGQGLRAWARRQDWPDQTAVTGTWSGRELVEGRASGPGRPPPPEAVETVAMQAPPSPRARLEAPTREATTPPTPVPPQDESLTIEAQTGSSRPRRAFDPAATVFAPDEEDGPRPRRRGAGVWVVIALGLGLGVAAAGWVATWEPEEVGALPDEATVEASPPPEPQRAEETVVDEEEGVASSPADPDLSDRGTRADPSSPAADPPVRSRPQPKKPERIERPALTTAPVATGRLTVTGRGVTVRLRQGGRVASPGEVAAGRWQVQADFGDGWTEQGRVVVPSGGEVTLTCRTLMQTCE